MVCCFQGFYMIVKFYVHCVNTVPQNLKTNKHTNKQRYGPNKVQEKRLLAIIMCM